MPRRVGIGVGICDLWPKGAGTVPTSLASLVLWTDSNASHTFQDTAGATPVTAAGQSIARKSDRSAGGLHRTQATAANQPTWQAGPTARYDATNDELFGTALSLAGDFTVYAVGRRNASGDFWTPIGTHAAAATDDAVEIHSSNALYLILGGVAGIPLNGNPTGLIVVRIRRNAGTAYGTMTGVAEASLGALAGTAGFTAEGNRKSAGHRTTNNGEHTACLVFSADIVSTGEAPGIEVFIAQEYGASL